MKTLVIVTSSLYHLQLWSRCGDVMVELDVIDLHLLDAAAVPPFGKISGHKEGETITFGAAEKTIRGLISKK